MVAALLYADQNLMAPNLTQIAEDFGFNDVVCAQLPFPPSFPLSSPGACVLIYLYITSLSSFIRSQFVHNHDLMRYPPQGRPCAAAPAQPTWVARKLDCTVPPFGAPENPRQLQGNAQTPATPLRQPSAPGRVPYFPPVNPDVQTFK